MSNKEKLAEEKYPVRIEKDFWAENYDVNEGFRKAFISGYEAAEQEMIRFAEWCGLNYVKLHAVWCHRFADQLDENNYFTTQQLLDKFRASQFIKY